MPLLSTEELTNALGSLPGWNVREGKLSKDFEFAAYTDGVLFASDCAQLAEERDHHPDMLITFRKVCIALSTHSEGGITDKDASLALQIEQMHSGKSL